MEAQLEELRNTNAGQELELQALRRQVQKKEVPRSPFKDAAVLEALPRLPHSSVTVSATILSPKHAQTSIQCLLHLCQKLKQEPLSVPTQKLVDKLVLAAQVRCAVCTLGRYEQVRIGNIVQIYMLVHLTRIQQRDMVVQSVAKEETVRKQREEMLVTFVRDHHSSTHAR